MNKENNDAIGFLGGTFDPIHFGHLRPAIEIQQALNLKSLFLMPNYIAPHKSHSLANSQQRIDMLTLAIQDTPSLQISTQELLRNSPSYTIDTLKILRQEHPTTPLCFIMGMDSLINFNSWYQYREILDYCHLVVSYRPGWKPQFNDVINELLLQHETSNSDDIHRALFGKIYFQKTTQLEISSSKIRALAAQKKNIHFLTPSRVCDYIETQQCYMQLN